MAGGWTRDGAVQDQIDDTVKDAVLRARALTPQGESAEECDDCGEPIPKKRREALPGVRTCVACQSERDKRVTPFDHQPPRQQGQPVALGIGGRSHGFQLDRRALTTPAASAKIVTSAIPPSSIT